MNEGAGGELVGEQAPNQFFRRSRQPPVAITFDPELRLTHGLRLRETLVALFPSITHAIRVNLARQRARWSELMSRDIPDVKCWRNGGGDDPIWSG
ncbi:hypothetical protein PIB30_042799 [Stylosanthes scabra]|uniref:Uncharacterized protein n=1 Tax=Stylosanthes scabra TaxID=79078 RepID=A0ABU6RFE1_9FABA|nr:hypothetical protein [Stylosanthes scabra]